MVTTDYNLYVSNVYKTNVVALVLTPHTIVSVVTELNSLDLC